MSSITSNVPSGLPALLEEQQKHLDLITHLISHSELLVVVYGPEGSGKSLLSRSLCTDSDNSICLTYEQITGLEDVLDVLAQLWELPTLDADLAQARAMVVDESKALKHQDSPVKIIIDDAHKLDFKLLTSIAELALEISDSAAMALFGELGFADKLQKTLDDAPLYFYKLTPLALASVKDLIRQAGISLSDDEFQTLYQLHDNWPGTMLDAARHAVEPNSENIQTLTEKAVIDTDEPSEPNSQENTRASFGTKHIFALAGLATLLVMMLIYSQNYDQQATSTLDLSAANSLPGLDENEPQTPEETDYNYSQSPELSQGLESADLSANQPKLETTPEKSKESESKPLSKESEKLVVESQLKGNESPQKKAKPQEQPQKTLSSQEQVNTQAQPRIATPANKAQSKTAKLVVQLFGSYDLEAAKKLKDSLKLNQPVQVYLTTRNQRNWYITALGPYSSKVEAAQRLRALPAKLKAQSPWIRSTKNLTLQP